MASAPSLPPEAGLRAIAATLDAAGIAWAIGGSALLASLGLVDEVRDWDLTCDADPETVRALFQKRVHSYHGHGGCHADHKLTFDPERVEVICRFAFFAPDGVVRVPTAVVWHWRGWPIGSPEGWACAYWLMGRYDEPAQRERRARRADALLAWLAREGADRARLDVLLAQPLPLELRDRLGSLAGDRA